MTDELEERLRAADPAPPTDPVDPGRSPRAQTLVEQIMTVTEDPIPIEAARRSRRPVALLGAAAAVAVVAILGTAFVLGGDDEPTESASIDLTSAPSDPLTEICIELTADTVRSAGADLAFRGTVTAVDGDVATLAVDEVFVGGPADEVTVTSPPEADTALIGSVPLEDGGTYLVSASDGVVLSCGVSGEASADLEAIYAAAYG